MVVVVVTLVVVAEDEHRTIVLQHSDDLTRSCRGGGGRCGSRDRCRAGQNDPSRGQLEEHQIAFP